MVKKKNKKKTYGPTENSYYQFCHLQEKSAAGVF